MSTLVQRKCFAHVSRVWLHVGFDSTKLSAINANVQIISGAVAVHTFGHVFVPDHMWVWRAAQLRVIRERDTATNVVGMTVGVLLAAQLYWPALNFDIPWLSFGRLRPLHTNAVIFAFGGNVLLATSFYVVQRTCHARLAGVLGLQVEEVVSLTTGNAVRVLGPRLAAAGL